MKAISADWSVGQEDDGLGLLAAIGGVLLVLGGGACVVHPCTRRGAKTNPEDSGEPLA